MRPTDLHLTTPDAAAMDRALPFPPLNRRRAYLRACRAARRAEDLEARGASQADRQRAHDKLCAYWRAYDAGR